MDVVEDTSFSICRDYIKTRLLKPSSALQRFDKEKMQIKNLFERTVNSGESNSALLIGPRSCGKSVLVKNVLAELNGQQSFMETAVVVYLNGLIHSDDGVALKAIACQMSLSNMCEGRLFGSLAENLSFFLDCLKSGNREKSKATILILDEFDLFCSRAKQTLLYNLFDVSQSAQAPLCVVGLTCRLDVVELLEKRVKSRFSNRQIYLFPENDKLGLQEVVERFQDLLSLHVSSENKMKPEQLVLSKWNKEVKLLCDSLELQNMIKYFNHVDISERQLYLLLISVVSKLHSEHTTITLMDFSEAFTSFAQDKKVNMLGSLSILELCLVVAMKHHSDIYEEEPFNFEMIHRTYEKFITQNSLDYTIDRSVIMKAFENIVNLEFIIPVKSGSYISLKEHQMFRLVLLPEQVKMGVQNYQNLPTEVIQWIGHSVN